MLAGLSRNDFLISGADGKILERPLFPYLAAGFFPSAKETVTFAKFIWAILLISVACRMPIPVMNKSDKVMNQIAESYVKLALALGEQDPDYVDAYFGPAEWREAAKAEQKDLSAIKDSAAALVSALEKLPANPDNAPSQLRHRFLARQLESLIARVEMLSGRKMQFDEEAAALYDARPPVFPESHFAAILNELNLRLPGDGSLSERYRRFKNGFIIPPEKLDGVFAAAIMEARRRTRAYVALPAGETFKVEYVRDKSWSGYNWYQGHYYSLIQVNTDLPIYIDRALDLACHEGYPGHHVYNALLEENLLRKNGWIEFSVYPLFSPESLIAEGSANYGIDLAFPGQERIEFEKSLLFPLAGLDPSGAARYYEVNELAARLSYSGNEAARHYLDGDWSVEKTQAWLEKYSLMEPDRARQRLRFIEKYRSYVINYNLGLDLIRSYVGARAGTAPKPERRWMEFAALLSSPHVPSDLKQ